ncbi:hypothetical protein FE248_07290 [Aliarcobacter cibarius]|nr:hypothetical protein FE248_07290 [Aliarcobacter cibarius]
MGAIKIIYKVKEWQARTLETIYTFLWLDAIHYKIKDGWKYFAYIVTICPFLII